MHTSRWLRTRALALALVLVLPACGNDSHAESKRDDAWRADLASLTTQIADKHVAPFTHTSRDAWTRSIAALDANIPTLDDAHVMTGMVRLVASLGDSHTLVGAYGKAGVYPIRFTWFDDGIFVTGAAEPWAVGKKLVGVGSHTIDQAITAIEPLIAHDSPAGLHAHLDDILGDAALLAGVDLASIKGATFVLASADGQAKKLDLVPGTSRAPIAPPAKLPLHLQGPPYAYWNKYDEATKMLYFAYNACVEDPKAGPFAKLAEGTLGFLDTHPVQRVVIDLRSNEGGNSQIIEPLLDGLAKRPALAGHIYALIGMHTFSSAMLDAMALKRRLHATLVGGPTSGKPTSYGEVKVIELPSSHLRAQYSTKKFTNNDFPGDAVMPDILVKVTSADWFSGRDPAIDAILAH